MDKFWLVWSSRGGSIFPHSEESSAKIEAVRLAIKHPSTTFVVMESIGHYVKDEPIWHSHNL